MTSFADVISGRKVLVFGLGRQGGGTGDASWLREHGAVVRVSDKDLELCPEGQTEEQIDWAEIVIKNPAVPDDHVLITRAKSRGLQVYTSVAVYVKYAKVKTIGVTGTRGKSTTVALIAAMLEANHPGSVISGGNIAGTSCLSLFDQEEDKEYAVLELSSFQLHNFHDLRVSPSIALVTNLYPDHLNRYTSMEEYRQDKEAVCAYQQSGDICVFNSENEGAIQIATKSPGEKIPFSSKGCQDWETNLPGDHNKANIAGMAALSRVLKFDEKLARKIAAEFSGLPFRLEGVGTIGGVKYVNDTTATTPTAAIKALEAITTPIVWITGGDTKQLPYTELLKEVGSNSRIKQIIVLGGKNIPEYTGKLKQIAGDKIAGTVHSMSEAVLLARRIASSGDTVLLSPGFTSFDLFKNEFDRGRQFNEAVRIL